MAKGLKFRFGEDVAHIDNLNVKMRVHEIIHEKGRIKSIKCRYWNDGTLRFDEFHSKELVPYSIAEKGEEEVASFLKSIE